MVPLFWVLKRNPSKNRERGGAWALGGRRFINTHNNQTEVGVHGGGDVGEEARWAGSAWGGCRTIVWGVELSDGKIEK